MDAVIAVQTIIYLARVGSIAHLHGLLEHDITENQLHQVFCRRLKLAVHVAWNTPTQEVIQLIYPYRGKGCSQHLLITVGILPSYVTMMLYLE